MSRIPLNKINDVASKYLHIGKNRCKVKFSTEADVVRIRGMVGAIAHYCDKHNLSNIAEFFESSSDHLKECGRQIVHRYIHRCLEDPGEVKHVENVCKALNISPNAFLTRMQKARQPNSRIAMKAVDEPPPSPHEFHEMLKMMAVRDSVPIVWDPEV
jgi:hypothetical protein